jgi:ribonuclease BN (tRNA processing enzyme)
LVSFAKRADLLVSELSSTELVREGLTKNGTWQAMSEAQQTEFLRHLREEHLSATDVGNLAADANVRAVILTHLPVSAATDEDYGPLVTAVKTRFAGEVMVGKDLMRY